MKTLIKFLPLLFLCACVKTHNQPAPNLSCNPPITEVNTANYDQEVLQSNVEVMAMFSASWCFWCRKDEPIFQELAKENCSKVKFVHIDVDANYQLEIQNKFNGIPTYIVFKNGKEYDRWVGDATKAQMKEMIQ